MRHTFIVSRLFWIIASGILLSMSVQAAPQRLVSLAPNLTEIVVALGGTDRLIAVTPFCQAPESIQRIPGGIQPEAETVLVLEPDLVLATSMTPEPTRRQLQDLGLRVETIDAHSLADIRQAIERTADLLSAPRPATQPTARIPSGKSAALLFGADTGYSAGCGTHAHEILEAAGLHNIAAEVSGPWPQLGEEFLLSKDPDLLIVADYGRASRDGILATLRAHPVRRHLSAVKSGKVIVFPAAAFSIPGPEALGAAQKLRNVISQP
jgi:iron complex transport system substrate-binding protein